MADLGQCASCAHTMHTAFAMLDRSIGNPRYFTPGEFARNRSSSGSSNTPRFENMVCVMCCAGSYDGGGMFAPKLLEAHSLFCFPTFHGSTGQFEPPIPQSRVRQPTCKGVSINLFIELFLMWFFRQTGLRKQELRTGSKLRPAIEEARSPSLFRRSLDLQLLDDDPRWMSAVSPGARIRWGELVCEEFSDHFHLGPNKPEPDQRIFLVTLCDRRCCTSHQEKNIEFPGLFGSCVGGCGACRIWA